MKRMLKTCGLVLCLMGLSLLDAWAYDGTCQNFDFPHNAEGQVDWPYTVKVIEQDAVVESDPVSYSGTRILDFHTSLRVVDVQGSRVLVRENDAYAPLGWVERSALLCAVTAFKGTVGNVKKVYALSVDASSAINNGVIAYPVSDLLDCAGQCRTLAPFSGYFVFAERNGSYLLGDTYFLDDSSRLTGWLSQKEALLWEGVIGLRPADDETICVYPSLEEAFRENAESCVSVPGNSVWHGSDRRLLLLDRQQYKAKPILHVFMTLPEGLVSEDIPMMEAYIPASASVEEDVWMLSDDLDRWLSLLREFQIFEDVYTHEYGDLREKFVFALTDALEKVLRQPLRELINMPLRDYVQQECGLSAREDSPLLRYSIADLMAPQTVPECEIARLITWLHRSEQLLSIVYHGDQRPLYDQETFPGECPSSEAIPYIPGGIRSETPGDDQVWRYDHNFQKARFYWAPKIFLP